MSDKNEGIDSMIDGISGYMISQIIKSYPKVFEPHFTNGEIVYVPVQDGRGKSIKICIFIVKAQNPLPENPIVLFAPGDLEKIDDYQNEYKYFCPFGVNFCVMAYRGRRYSEGDYLTFGPNEIEDVIHIIRYLEKSGYTKISYFGRSRGATCGLFAAHEFPNLASIALDSPRIHIQEYDKYISKKTGYSIEKVDKILPEILKNIKNKTGIDFSNDLQPFIFAAELKQPIYIIHGEKDRNIPISESRELFSLLNSEEKIFLPFDGDHDDIKIRLPYWKKQFYFIVKHSGAHITEDEYLSNVENN